MRHFARENRKEPTKEEKELWQLLRNRKFMGLRFKRQHIIYWSNSVERSNFFILDFYCHKLKLGLELDGRIHEEQKDYDRFRDEILQNMGIEVLRISNKEMRDIQKLKMKLSEKITELKSQL